VGATEAGRQAWQLKSVCRTDARNWSWLSNVTLQPKHRMYSLPQDAIIKDSGHPLQFSRPADHPRPAECEEQFCGLVKELKGDAEHLSVHHADNDPATRADGYDSADGLCNG
jgi:hypothetical protein